MQAGVKSTTFGLLGALVGGAVVLFYTDFSGEYVATTTLIVALAVALGAGIGSSVREHTE